MELKDLRQEIWKPIKNFEQSYEVSNFGNVRSIDRYRYCKSKNKANLFKGKILKQRQDKDGYLIVNLKEKQKSHLKKVHRLVAEAFIENTNSKLEINHIDGIKANNSVNNLEWTTSKQNQIHRVIHWLSKPALTKEQIKYIRKNVVIGNKKNNSIRYLARKFNVCVKTVADVVYNTRPYLLGV